VDERNSYLQKLRKEKEEKKKKKEWEEKEEENTNLGQTLGTASTGATIAGLLPDRSHALNFLALITQVV
jgi:hypothetical protein